MHIVITILKDALLCVLIATTLAGMKKDNAYPSVGFIILLIIMGVDL